MLIKACVNGARPPSDHPRLPYRPDDVAADVLAVVAAGAGAVHVHPKDANGIDTLEPEHVDAVMSAIRQLTPDVPIGVTTGAWTHSDPGHRVELIHGWQILPDFASVNWHETGAVAVAEALLSRGIEVEAGLWTPKAVIDWLAWDRRQECLRVLLEVVDAGDPVQAAAELVESAGGAGLPILLHGEGKHCWPVFDEAVRRGLDSRIGLEDTLTLPDGTHAADNAELVRAALARA